MFKSLKRRVALGAVAAVGAAGLVTIAAPAANAAAYGVTGITASAVGRVGGDLQVRFVATGAATYSDSFTVWAKILSAPTGASGRYAGGSVVNLQTRADSGTAGFGITSGTSAGRYVSFGTPDTNNVFAAGTYTMMVWTGDSATTSSAYPGANSTTDPSTTVTFTAGGAPASITLSAATASAITADSATATTGPVITATIKDAAGNPTLLNSGELIQAKSASAAWVSNTNASTGNQASAAKIASLVSGTLINNGTVKFYAGNKSAGTDIITVSAGGLLSGVTAQTYTLTTFDAVTANDTVTLSSALTGVSKADGSFTDAAATVVTSSQALYASNATAKSITYSYTAGTANAGKYVLATISDPGNGLPTGVTAGTTTLTLDSTGSTTFTVAATAAAATTQYSLKIGGVTVTVTYGSPVATTVVKSPLTSSVGSVSTVVGGSTTIKAVVKDQYGDAVSGALVSFYEKSGERNAVANALLSTVTSDATGSASFTLTDASTSTTVLSDVVKVSAISVGLSSPITLDPALTINYVASVTPAKITVSKPASGLTTGGTPATCLATAPCLPIDTAATWTAALTSATGTTLPAGIAVTWSITGGYAASLTSYTDGTGVASLAVKPNKIGAVNVTATVGAVSGSNSSVTAINSGTTDARTISLDAATYAVTGGQVKRVTATVKDRWGNPVAGVNVTFAFTGVGRFAGGGLSYGPALTGADGTVVADIAPLASESGSGTLKASYTAQDASTATLLGDAVTAYPAASTSASATVTTTAGAATATTDAATTSKINDIATAVANLSTTVAGLVASLVAQIKDTKAAIADTKAALDALAAVVAKIQKKVKA